MLEPSPGRLLLGRLWAARLPILLTWLLLLGLGAGAVLLWPRAYVAQAIVAPQDSTNISTTSILSPVPMFQTGLLDTRPSGNFAIYLGALRSREAALDLLQHTALRQALEDQARRGVVGWLRRRGVLDEPKVTADDAADWIERRTSTTQSLVNITWTLEVRSEDRALALEVLRRLHTLAEARARADLANLVGARLSHLNARLVTEQDQYVRAILYDLVGQQSRFAMVLAADQAVAARLVSDPWVEDEPSLPNRPVLLVLLCPSLAFAVLGAAAAILAMRPEPPRATRTRSLRLAGD